MAGVAKVRVVPDPRVHPRDMVSAPGVWERLQLEPGRFVSLRVGQKELRQRVAPPDPEAGADGDDPPLFRLHPSAFSQLSLPPEGLWAHVRADGGDDEDAAVRIGPFVAVLCVRGGGGAPFGAHELYFRSLAAFGRPLGIPTYMFSVRDVDWNRRVVRGFRWFRGGRRGWRRGEFPFPDVVYDRLLSRRAEARPAVQATRQRLLALPGVHYFNPGYFDKWDVHQRLAQRPELAAYLPETRPLTSVADVRDFCRRYRTVFLKPTGGSLGLGIAVIRRRGRGYLLTQSTRAGSVHRSFPGFGALSPQLKAYVGSRNYIVQQGLPLARLGRRCFDVRIIMQKDTGGRWQRTKSYARVAPPGSMTSNLSGGGTAVRLGTALRAAFGKNGGRRIAREVHSLAAELTPLIEEQIGGTVGEFGLDLGLDRNGKVWIIEVNSKPYLQMTPGSGSRRAIQLSALRPLRWARYLAGFEAGDDVEMR